MKNEFCIDTVERLRERFGKTINGAVFHRDRGCQYTSYDFRTKISTCGMCQSLSGTAHCFDNARMESFFATLKKEKLYRIPTYRMTREQVKRVIFRYIFGYYNTLRVNSFNPDGLPPVVYRLSSIDSVRAAWSLAVRILGVFWLDGYWQIHCNVLNFFLKTPCSTIWAKAYLKLCENYFFHVFAGSPARVYL